jgi:hypothetical protein
MLYTQNHLEPTLKMREVLTTFLILLNGVVLN